LNYKQEKAFYKNLAVRVKRLSWPVKIIFVLFSLSLLLLCLKSTITYDDGLYYTQTMLWNKEFGTVPGLGNLHSRLGFNSTFLLLSTLFYNPKYFPLYFPLNSLIVLFINIWIIGKISNGNSLINRIILLIILTFSLYYYFPYINSLSTDVLPNFLIIYILLRFLTEKETKNKGLFFVFIPVLCITFKLSSLPICIVSVYFLFQYFRNKKYKELGISLLLGSLIIIPWCIRFIMLTGYLIYPFPQIDIFTFDWKMPVEMVETERIIIHAWAKLPNVPLEQALSIPFDKWIAQWFSSHSFLIKTALILFTLSPVIFVIRSKRLCINKRIILVWLTALAGSLLNFFTAPDFRFSFGFVMITAFCLYYSFNNSSYPKANRKILFYTVTILCGCFFIKKSIDTLIHNDKTEISFLYKPSTFYFGNNDQDSKAYKYLIGNTLIYSTNPIGENPVICYEICNNRCFDHELPCTPYLNPNLELRGQSLKDGFRIRKE